MKSLGARLWQSAYLLLTLTIIFWAGNAIVGRAVRDVIPPATFAAFRWSGATVLLLPFALPRLGPDLPRLRAGWRIVLLLGLLGVAMFNTLLYAGLHYTTATNALLIQAATAPLVLMSGWMLFRDRVGPAQMLATLLSIAGVLMVVAQGNLSALLALKFGMGDVLILIATVGWAFYTVLLRNKPQVHPLSLLLATFLIGMAVTVPLALLELGRGARLVWSGEAVAAILYVAIFPSLLAYIFFTRGVELAGAALSGQFNNAMPLVGAALAALLLGEALHWYHWVGMAMILVAMLWFARGQRR